VIVSTIYGLVYGAQHQQKLMIKLLGAFDILIVLGWGGIVSLWVLVFFEATCTAISRDL
jgi:hypothetical protein